MHGESDPVPPQLETRHVGRSGLVVTELGFGAGPLGGFAGRPVDEASAETTLGAAWDAGIRYFDTSPWYGLGMSEHRVGQFLRGKPRDAFVISTKVGRVLHRPGPGKASTATFWTSALPFDAHFDYRHDAILRSYEDSLQRLGLSRVDILFVHDLEPEAHGGDEGFDRRVEELEAGGGFAALEALRTAGEIGAIGAGVNDATAALALVRRFDLDAVLIAGRYTLLEQGALEALLPVCEERKIGVVIGSVFNSGILAGGGAETSTYEGEPAPEEIAERVGQLQHVCSRHGVALGSAALRFPLAHPAVCSVIPGAARPSEVTENARRLHWSIPPALWEELRSSGLIAREAPIPADDVG
ncbi:MAG: pld1 2 [Acidimicrobiaceae bacterium]|nr:pld1 2 [Acidimicrobiaceae bacterium]